MANSKHRGFHLGNLHPSYVQSAYEQFGVNILRLALIWFPEEVNEWNLQEYEAWLYPHLDNLEACLDKCAELNIKGIIDLHSPVGGFTDWSGIWGNKENVHRFFVEKWAKKALKRHWREIATRFKSHPATFAYEFINEPSPPPKQKRKWNKIQKK